jgi:lipid A 4'-phosphatase
MAESHARTMLVLIVMAIVVVGVAFAINPEWDLALTRVFYDPKAKQFPLTFNSTISWLRDQAVLITIASFACLIAAVTLKLILPRRQMLIPGRALIFLVVTFALGPGLLVNGLLKECWSRPRPAEVVEFGGDKAFMPWWDPRGGCDQNCSFVSGETSTAAWTLAPAILIPGPLGTVAIGASTVFMVGMGAMRLAAGGHFFTDVTFAILFTLMLIWAVHGLIYRWPRTALDEDKIEQGIGRFAWFVRNDALAALRTHGLAWIQLLYRRVGDARVWLRGSASPRSKEPLLRQLGVDPELIDRLQDLREAYLGAPTGRIVAEALEFFIADRLKAEPEIKRRYDEARRRRLGLTSGAVRLVSAENQTSDKDRGHPTETPPAAMS